MIDFKFTKEQHEKMLTKFEIHNSIHETPASTGVWQAYSLYRFACTLGYKSVRKNENTLILLEGTGGFKTEDKENYFQYLSFEDMVRLHNGFSIVLPAGKVFEDNCYFHSLKKAKDYRVFHKVSLQYHKKIGMIRPQSNWVKFNENVIYD